jgi:hypothetical protein
MFSDNYECVCVCESCLDVRYVAFSFLQTVHVRDAQNTVVISFSRIQHFVSELRCVLFLEEYKF